MAKASAKKAAAAQESAKSFYLPFLLVINILWFFLKCRCHSNSDDGSSSFASITTILEILVLGALQFYAYWGILEAHSIAATTSTTTTTSKKSTTSTALVGGHSLDILGLTVFVQFVSVIVTPKAFWLLLILPLWGAWALYKMITGR